MQSIHWLLQLTTSRDFIPKLWNPGVISFRPTTKFFILLANSKYLSAPFCHLSLHFKGLLKQLSKHNYNWLAGSPFWVSEVLDKHIHIPGGYQCRWTYGHNTSKLGPIFMVQLLSIDQDSNLCLTKDARCLITWHQHLLGKSWTPSIGPRLHSTILASGTWDFKVSNYNFNSGLRFAFLRLTSISGIFSAIRNITQTTLQHPTTDNQPVSSGKSLSVLQTAKAQKHSWFFQMPNSFVA